MAGISLQKLEKQAPGLVSLRKEADSAVSATDLDPDHRAKVSLLVDRSYSMSGMFASGLVQAVAEKVLVLASIFDDDGDIDIFGFGDKGWKAGVLTLDNYQGGIDRLMSSHSYGSTNLTDGLKEVRKAFSGRKRWGRSSKPEFSGYCLVVSDGEPDDMRTAAREFTDSALEPIWWECVGVPANARLPFLKAVDNPDEYLNDPYVGQAAQILAQRDLDNAHTFAADPDDPQLFRKMLTEYPAWVDGTKGRLWG